MKKGLLLLLCLCLCFCLPIFAGAEQPAEGAWVGIISAMDNEVALLLGEAKIDHVDSLGGVDFHVGSLCGHDVVIARAGVGKVLAASGASTMLSHYPVSALIFTGIAGGVGDETQVLDMVIAEELVQHDYGNMTQEGFQWDPPFRSRTGGYSFCDEQLVEAACRATAEVIGEEHTFRGLIVTGDQFVASESYVNTLREKFGALACEMEGAAVAAVCEQFGVPFVVLRALSDKADEQAHASVMNMGDQAADRSGRIVMKMLESLPLSAEKDAEEQGSAEENSTREISAAEASAADADSLPEPAYADKLFDQSSVHRIDVRLAEEDWAGLLAAPTEKTKYAAEVDIDGETFRNVSFSTKGYSSLYFVAYGEPESRRYSFRITFGEQEAGQTCYGLDRLSLNNLYCDRTWMKDLISYDLFRDAGVPAPLVSYTWLTVNGTDQGLYMTVEDQSKSFLNRVYQGQGVLYSVELPKLKATREMTEYVLKNGFTGNPAANGADLMYREENLANYTDILDHAVTEATPRDRRMVVLAIRALNRHGIINRYFNMDEIIRFFAAHNYLLDFDSYTGSQLNNLKLYQKDGVLSVLPWDYNLAFATYPWIIGPEKLENPTGLLNLGIDTPLIGATEEDRPLWKLIRNTPEYLDSYHEVLNTLVSEHLLNGDYEKKIDGLRDMLLPWIEKDPTAFCSAAEFEQACETLKAFLACRSESVRRQLSGELSTDSETQDPRARVDASGLNLLNLGALVIGK